ncbi:MAG: hypothetical protein KDI44_10320 [Thiothrix sp.]|nr:hypothetical protein [Thiothrix sp.]
MKALISPPIQTLLWLAGISCLAWGGWSVWQLRQMDMSLQQSMTEAVNVEIPTTDELRIPTVNAYQQMVQAPLFWQTRAVPPPPPPAVAAREVVAPPPSAEPPEIPEGRLVGIVDLGKKRYALVRDQEEKNLSLHVGDKWGDWVVEAVSKRKLVLAAGEEHHEIPLIADFAAPQENKQLLADRQRREQQKKIEQQRAALRQQQQTNSNAAPAPAAQPPQIDDPAAAPDPAQQLNQLTDPTSPVLSIKEALEARQRLMASRWGGGNTSPPNGTGNPARQ